MFLFGIRTSSAYRENIGNATSIAAIMNAHIMSAMKSFRCGL